MNEEPMIVVYGRGNTSLFTPEEYVDSLRKAFVRGGGEPVVLDSNPNGQRFLAACTAWAIDAGLLVHDHSRWDTDDEVTGQSIISWFTWTEKGRAVLANPSEAPTQEETK